MQKVMAERGYSVLEESRDLNNKLLKKLRRKYEQNISLFILLKPYLGTQTTWDYLQEFCKLTKKIYKARILSA